MKPVHFVVCFTLGVTLMVFSGYLPQTASAGRSTSAEGGGGLGTPAVPERPTVTHRATGPEWAPIEDPYIEGEFSEPVASPALPAPGGGGQAVEVETEPAAAQAVTPAESPAARPEPEPELELPLITADAGPDRTVWIGWDDLVLDGRESIGEKLTYEWVQTKGAVTLAIRDGRRPKTTAGGLLKVEKLQWRPEVYEFELTVRDPHGQEDTDAVQFRVLAAPELKISPRADRRFEVRDGFELGHYEAWATNLDSYQSVFEIKAESPLSFTKVSGGRYAITGGEVDDEFVYQVTLYGQEGEAAAWVEFLVDTEERVPGVVLLGVNWEQ